MNAKSGQNLTNTIKIMNFNRIKTFLRRPLPKRDLRATRSRPNNYINYERMVISKFRVHFIIAVNCKSCTCSRPSYCSLFMRTINTEFSSFILNTDSCICMNSRYSQRRNRRNGNLRFDWLYVHWPDLKKRAECILHSQRI